MADLLNYHYEGGPYVQGTRLRDSFFSDYGLGIHKRLAEKFPYEPKRRIAEYVHAVQSEIAQIKTEHHEAYHRWLDLTQGWLRKYRLSDWSWYAWRNLRDETVTSWNALVQDSIGVVDKSARRQLSPNRPPDWGSVLRWLRETLSSQRTKADESSAITVWSNRIVLPLGHVLLLLPLLFAGSNFMLADLYAQRRAIQIDVARLDQYIGDILHVHLASSSHDMAVLRSVQLWRAAISGDWSTVHQLDPNFASNLLLSALSWGIALWLIGRSIEIAFKRERRLVSRYDPVILVAVLFFSAVVMVLAIVFGNAVVRHALESNIG